MLTGECFFYTMKDEKAEIVMAKIPKILNDPEKVAMRKVIYSMMVSLDGYIESTDGDIDWSAPDEKLHQHFNDLESTIDVHLYGRRLYENMAAYWPTADENPSRQSTRSSMPASGRTSPRSFSRRRLLRSDGIPGA